MPTLIPLTRADVPALLAYAGFTDASRRVLGLRGVPAVSCYTSIVISMRLTPGPHELYYSCTPFALHKALADALAEVNIKQRGARVYFTMRVNLHGDVLYSSHMRTLTGACRTASAFESSVPETFLVNLHKGVRVILDQHALNMQKILGGKSRPTRMHTLK